VNKLIQRLTESGDQLKPVKPFAGAPVKDVVIDSRPVEFWRCPHCQEEIHEKHTYTQEGVDYHADCGGPIKPPPTDWSKISPEWRELLRPYVKD
jgi:hypothetical protein